MADSQFPKLVDLMARLRAPDGCPWDRQQTFDSLKPYLLEETYEVLDAIAQRNWEELTGELGDLMLQIVFFSQMASEQGHFTIEDVIEHIHTKMVRRHPHVFGDAKAATASDVVRNWEALKAEEKKQRLAERGTSPEPQASLLSGVPDKIPSLIEAYQISSRVSHAGFDWPSFQDLLDKLQEEIAELQAEIAQKPDKPKDSEAHSRIESEVGDLLFTAVNVARFLRVEPESALRRTNQKFRRRFQWIEQELKKSGKSPREATLEEMDALWNQAKETENSND